MRSFLKKLFFVALLFAGSWLVFGQKQTEDKLFRLVQADEAQQLTEFGTNYRRVKGHARFLHNGTYLLCDSASWNVDAKFIEAYGNVQIIQNNTYLKSQEMVYWIDDNTAEFRGGLVELYDKEGNILRTNRLKYNTKDSIATFDRGGAMKDKDGNVIESTKGTYEASIKCFTFDQRVELYMDSILIKTSNLRYFTEPEKAHFGSHTYMWKDDGFLKANAGWYDRKKEMVYFANQVYMDNPDYEAWSDELYYDQVMGGVDLYNNAQILDTANLVTYLGDHLTYVPATDSTEQKGILTDNPAIIYYGENENHEVDTLYMRADTILVFSVPKNEMDSEEITAAKKRVEDMMFDALAKKRVEEGKVREEERIQKMRDAGLLPPEWVEQQEKARADSLAAVARADSLAAVADSLGISLESLMAEQQPQQNPSVEVSDGEPADPALAANDSSTVEQPLDSTPIRHVYAYHDVRVYRSDIQAKCDSVAFNELDSIARLYGTPVLWNEVKNQLTAVEMQLLMKDGNIQRGSMLTDAWLISQVDSTHYDQIKSPEMMGYFFDNQLYRFDALGGVSAVFYLDEEGVLTTVNVKESKSLVASLKDGTAQRLLYLESIKSDAYPIAELAPEKQYLKDFKWRGDERPVDPSDITLRKVRPTERGKYDNIARPYYAETNGYFEGYMEKLLAELDAKRIAKEQAEYEARVEREYQERRIADSLARAAEDSIALAAAALAPAADSLAAVSTDPETDISIKVLTPDQVTDETGNSPAVRDSSLSPIVAPFETVDGNETVQAVPADGGEDQLTSDKKLTRAEKKAFRKAQRKARREARAAARAARRAARAAAREHREE